MLGLPAYYCTDHDWYTLDSTVSNGIVTEMFLDKYSCGKCVLNIVTKFPYTLYFTMSIVYVKYYNEPTEYRVLSTTSPTQLA